MARRFWIHGATLLWATVVAVLLLWPRPQQIASPGLDLPPIILAMRDLSGHLVLFFAMAYFLHRSLRRTAVAVAVAFAYGGLLELGQTWIPGRGTEIVDLVANGLGAAAYALWVRSRTPRA